MLKTILMISCIYSLPLMVPVFLTMDDRRLTFIAQVAPF